jgi:flagellin
MSRINSNVPAQRAISRLGINNNDLQLRLERLSTGLRVNRGKDDPAGLIASEVLRSEIGALGQAIDNSARAINVLSTAEGALNEVSSLLLGIRELIVSTANEGALTDDEVAANQLEIDAILGSIDRIAQNTTFGGLRLLDGKRAFTLSGLDPNGIAGVSVFSARLPHGGARDITVQITQSAETGNLTFQGVAPPGGATHGTSGRPAFTSSVTVEIGGPLGTERFSFASGTTLQQIATAINDSLGVTGVSAIITTPAIGATTTSALSLHTTSYGSDAFVTVRALSGNFIETDNQGVPLRDEGVDVGAIINGQAASGRGLRADVRATGLDMRVFLTPEFAQVLSSTTMQITGGGSLFQLTPEVSPNGQITVGIDSVASASLGNSIVGYLESIRSGGEREVARGNFASAQDVITEAISQIASLRGRIGSIQKNILETNIDSQQIALENVTASESVIRDADMAAEVAALTRAQVLVQSTQATLQIAVNAPSAVLSLLQ